METLKLILVMAVLGALGAAGILFLWGGGDGVFRDEGSINVAGSPEDVFEWLSEPEQRTRWVGGLEDSRKETIGRLDVGSRLQETLTIDGHKEDRVVEITAFEPGRLLTLESRQEGVPVTIHYALKTHHSGRQSHLTFEVEARYEGWFDRLVEPLRGGSLFAAVQADLKSLAEEVRRS